MAKILICGASSFVANGFKELLLQNGCEVDTFGRKNGSYTEIDKCKNLSSEYDAVVNFAILKSESLEENVKYLESLVKMCKEKNVKKLIHFSSIMVYNYHLPVVNEKTAIDTLENTQMKGYGEIKIAVDQYLLSIKDTLPFEIIFVRPGYVLAEGVACPFIKKLPLGISVIKGNKKSHQPIVRREDIHKALCAIINTEHNNSVYHFFPNNGMTKYRYAKETVGGVILCMPKWLFKGIPALLCKMHIIPAALYSRFDGMYIESDFSSALTEQKLKMKFQ